MSYAVEMLGITKRFGAVTALDRVDLSVTAGSLHAVVGENGAGKTTLMRMLYGVIQPDEGEMFLASAKPETPTQESLNRIQFHTSREAIAAGVGMVSQHYGIIPALTCLQNLILGAEGGQLIDLRAAQSRAQTLAERMGFEIKWNQLAEELSPAGAQKLEILKLLWREARIMILDEPTAMLSPADSDALFASMRQLASEGATIILVTHRLPEVMDHCSMVTVLRGGKLIETKKVSETNPNELASLIVGASNLPAAPATRASANAAQFENPTLQINSLVVRGERGQDVLKGIGLQVQPGELLGIAGVDGSGQRELFQALLGLIKVRQGQILFNGADATRSSTAKRIKLGLRAIPEDRHAEAVIEEWSLDQNSALGLQRMPPLANGAMIDTQARTRWAERVAARFGTKHGGLSLPMSSLSGGNQQRFVAGRTLESDPKLILAFQPARGLDLKGTAEVYAAIQERCLAGAAAIVVSFDLDELLEHCHRIVAMNHGELFEPSAEEARSRDAIGRLMVGAS